MANEPINAKEQPANRDQASDTGIEDRIAEIQEVLRDAIEYYDSPGDPSRNALERLPRILRDADKALTAREAALDAKDVQIRTQQAQIETLTRELAMIDNVLARRPAMDQPTRWQNVEKAIIYATRTDEAETRGRSLQARAEHAEAALLRVNAAFAFAECADQLADVLTQYEQKTKTDDLLGNTAGAATGTELHADKLVPLRGKPVMVYQPLVLPVRAKPRKDAEHAGDPSSADLLARLVELSERLRAGRYDSHGDVCDDGEDAVPCGSQTCAIQYEAEVLLLQAAWALGVDGGRSAKASSGVPSNHKDPE